MVPLVVMQKEGSAQLLMLKPKKRNRMGYKLLNFLVWPYFLVWFNMNVSYEIEEFPALFYSRLWRQLKHLLVDDPTPPTKRQKLDEIEIFEDEYFHDNTKILVGKSSLFWKISANVSLFDSMFHGLMSNIYICILENKLLSFLISFLYLPMLKHCARKPPHVVFYSQVGVT